MSWFRRNTGNTFPGQGRRVTRRVLPLTGLLALAALLVAACGTAATPTSAPLAAATTEPTLQATVAPTDAPTPQPPAAPTNTPVPEVSVEPSVLVADQAVVNGTVTVAEVVSNGPGWLVIHAQADGSPGPILGYSPVADGSNANVVVEIDPANATQTLYAMLHVDAGQVGTWEFPGGPDLPAKVGDQIVTPAFQVTGGLAAAEERPAPSVVVADQALNGNSVTIAEVTSDGPGWLVVHAQANGSPGPILGYSPVASGLNSNVAVPLDLSAATSTLYAMLHTDAGTVGTFEFPGGADTPVTVDGQVVSPAFALQALAGEAEVEMEDFQFHSKVLVIKAGTTVKWGNRDEVIHTTTSDTGVWDSGSLSKGDEFSFTFTEPGVYPYYCKPHGGPGGQGMSGTVVVLQ